MDQFKRILPKNYSKPIWRAIMEFNMIDPGDRIMVGLSGGKDSSFLLYALWVLQKQTVIPFELAAVSIDPGFAEVSPRPILQDLCDTLDIPLFYEELPHLKEVIFTGEGNQSPCARCAFFRRGAMNRLAVKHGYGKLALGHHHDDAVETFVMSILYSGQITTFLPVTPQDRSGLTVIRPLIYLREKEIRAARKFFSFDPVSSCCPRDGQSTRSEVKALIHELHNKNHSIYDNLSAAMRFPIEKAVLWPPTLPREEMRKQYLRKISWKKK